MAANAPDETFDLNRLVIPTPCTRGWDQMTGDDRKRFCGQCQKYVYNLSDMSRLEIVDLIEGEGDQICGRLYRRADGTILTSDCQPAATASDQRNRFRFTIAHVLLLMTICAGAFASVPWLGPIIQPLVNRWLAAPTATPLPPQSFGPGQWIEGLLEELPDGPTVADGGHDSMPGLE